VGFDDQATVAAHAGIKRRCAGVVEWNVLVQDEAESVQTCALIGAALERQGLGRRAQLGGAEA
jgi:hypothetical protein